MAAKKKINTDAMVSELSGSAFFPSSSSPQEEDKEEYVLPEWMQHLRLISIDQIRPGPYQKRREEAKDHQVYRQLETQMRGDYERGQLRLFLFVVPDQKDAAFFNPSRGGHRRLEIAARLGVAEIPCYVEKYNQQELLRGTYSENMGRQDLTIIEEGLMYMAAMQDNGWTQEETALYFHVPGGRDRVAHCIQAACYEPDIQSMIFKDPVRSMRAASILAQLDRIDNAIQKRAPIITAFLSRQLTVGGVQIVVNRVLTGESFSLNDPLPVKEIARMERIQSACSGFSRYSKEIGHSKPSEAERKELEALAQEIAKILAR